MNKLTDVRTYCQFSQYGEVKAIIYNGNKLMAMNAIRFAYGVKSFSKLIEFKANSYLPEGNHSLSEIVDFSL